VNYPKNYAKNYAENYPMTARARLPWK